MADTARSATALKLFFETGDIPTQQQFADFISSYSNLVDNNALDLSDLAITAHAGGGQGSAYQITKRVNQITTVTTAGDSLKLPAALPGVEGYIFNTQTNSTNIFPTTGDNFVNLAANAALALPGSYVLFFYCTFTGQMLFKVLSDAGVSEAYPFVTATTSPLAIFPSLWSTYVVTALANSLTISAPSSVFASGQDLTIMITDNGTSRTLSWNSAFVQAGGSLPSVTAAGKKMIFSFKYESVSNKWWCVSTSIQGLNPTVVSVYRSLLSQVGSSAPFDTVLENTLGGNITWAYSSTGTYTGTLTGKFDSTKTFITLNLFNNADSIGAVSVTSSPNTFTITTVDFGGTPSNGAIINAAFQILVYP